MHIFPVSESRFVVAQAIESFDFHSKHKQEAKIVDGVPTAIDVDQSTLTVYLASGAIHTLVGEIATMTHQRLVSICTLL